MNIKFTGYDDPRLNYVRKLAKAEHYTSTAGIKEFAKIHLGATLYSGHIGFTSITFPDSSPKLTEFLLH